MADAPGGSPEVILIASDSEVSLIVEVHEMLAEQGIRSRVVSMPSWDIFEHQTREYQDSVLPPEVTARVAVEQASTLGMGVLPGAAWPSYRYAHLWRLCAPEGATKNFGFESAHVVAVAKELLGIRLH